MDTIEQTDRDSAAFYKAPRVSLADIEAAIAEKYFVSGAYAVGNGAAVPLVVNHPLSILTCCFLVMKNGFTIIGKSSPASPENYDMEYGKKLAYEDCVRQLWPLMGFALKEHMSKAPMIMVAPSELQDDLFPGNINYATDVHR